MPSGWPARTSIRIISRSSRPISRPPLGRLSGSGGGELGSSARGPRSRRPRRWRRSPAPSAIACGSVARRRRARACAQRPAGVGAGEERGAERDHREVRGLVDGEGGEAAAAVAELQPVDGEVAGGDQQQQEAAASGKPSAAQLTAATMPTCSSSTVRRALSRTMASVCSRKSARAVAEGEGDRGLKHDRTSGGAGLRSCGASRRLCFRTRRWPPSRAAACRMAVAPPPAQAVVHRLGRDAEPGRDVGERRVVRGEVERHRLGLLAGPPRGALVEQVDDDPVQRRDPVAVDRRAAGCGASGRARGRRPRRPGRARRRGWRSRGCRRGRCRWRRGWRGPRPRRGARAISASAARSARPGRATCICQPSPRKRVKRVSAPAPGGDGRAPPRSATSIARSSAIGAAPRSSR